MPLKWKKPNAVCLKDCLNLMVSLIFHKHNDRLSLFQSLSCGFLGRRRFCVYQIWVTLPSVRMFPLNFSMKMCCKNSSLWINGVRVFNMFMRSFHEYQLIYYLKYFKRCNWLYVIIKGDIFFMKTYGMHTIWELFTK